MQYAPRRPLGVTIIAILVAVAAVVEIISALTTLGSSRGLAISSLVTGVLYLGLAWGFWTLRFWAFWIAVVVSAIGLVVTFLGLVSGHLTVTYVIGFIISAVIFVYLLMDRSVRAAFHAR
jgi:uncharacterized membrane protein (DUF2068 family)